MKIGVTMRTKEWLWEQKSDYENKGETMWTKEWVWEQRSDYESRGAVIGYKTKGTQDIRCTEFDIKD